MSWFSDGASKLSSGYGKVMGKMAEYSVPGLIMKATGTDNPIEDFYRNEFVDKADLRGAEAVSFASKLPLVGGLVRGVEGVNQLEDLYNRTGKVPAYPGASSVGAGGIGKSVGELVRKIENGTHDLAEFYSGEKLGPLPVEGEDYITGDKYVNQ